MFFFVKQKTAYEMRISDWSSDVCSSDLVLLGSAKDLSATRRSAPDTDWQPSLACTRAVQQSSIGRKASDAFRPSSPPVFCSRSGRVRRPPPQGWNETPRHGDRSGIPWFLADRKSVREGKREAVGCDSGGGGL